MRKTKIVSLIFIIALSISITKCAVQRSQAPQITPQTSFDLDTGSQLQQFQRDYTTFFTDVGNAQKAGTLSQLQVDQLNQIGYRIKLSLESANKTFKTYMSTHDEPTRLQVVSLVNQLTQLFIDLNNARISMAGGVK
jgi:hypothetical protein